MLVTKKSFIVSGLTQYGRLVTRLLHMSTRLYVILELIRRITIDVTDVASIPLRVAVVFRFHSFPMFFTGVVLPSVFYARETGFAEIAV